MPGVKGERGRDGNPGRDVGCIFNLFLCFASWFRVICY
jgi:hypothetical protein